MAAYLEGLVQQKILSPASYAEMYTPTPLITFGTPQVPVVPGLGWDSVTATPNGPEIAKNGALPGFGAEYIVWPSQNFAIGVTANTRGFDIVGLVNAIYAALHPAPPPPVATTTTLAVSATSITVGESVTVTARVTPRSGGAPTGQVFFAVDGVGQTPVALLVSGGVAQATFTLTGLTQGPHVIAAYYSGSAADSSSAAAPLAVAVTAAATVADGPRVNTVARRGVLFQPTRLDIGFNTPLDAGSATNVASYTLTRVTIRGDSRPIKIASVTYDAATTTVTLRTGPRLPLIGLYRLVVRGTGPSPVRNAAGLALDGQATGQPGSDYTVVVTLANLVSKSRASKAGSVHQKSGPLHRRR
jgi:hypothetical protein